MKYLFLLSLLNPVGAWTTSPENPSIALSSKSPRPNRRSFLGWTASIFPSCASALTPEEASRKYDTYASSYDDLDGGKASTLFGIEEARRELIQNVKGDVLEIGVGTGTQQKIFLKQSHLAPNPKSHMLFIYSRSQSGQVCRLSIIITDTC